MVAPIIVKPMPDYKLNYRAEKTVYGAGQIAWRHAVNPSGVRSA